MGFNTTVLFLNDGIEGIKTDPLFNIKLYNQILKGEGDFSIGNHSNAGSVIETHHADHSVLIVAGGNYATVLSPYVCGYSHHTPENKLAILEYFAEQMGYTLRKK